MPAVSDRKVYTISELTRQIKQTLEDEVGRVWVEGEISNFKVYGSGHAYFSLKDDKAQLSAVLFAGSRAGVSAGTRLEDGQRVRAYGEITVFENRGQYQLIVRKVEPAGAGDLMRRFEELKRKLEAEGLFAPARKRPLPRLPQRIGLVTSPTGAVLHDILNVLGRRFPNPQLRLAPVKVQGAGAAAEIAAAVALFNRACGPGSAWPADVLIVGRGGGSLEDLWCFNEEAVVRAIVRSAIPVISAVGHEIDWTLSDFAADVRAPTPSAAAEMVVQGKAELERRVADLRRRLALGAKAATLGWRNRLDRAARTPGLRDPLQVVRQAQQSVDFLAVRLQKALAGLPQLVRQRAAAAARRMELAARMRLAEERRALQHAEAQLRMLNPKGVLARGYSLTKSRDGKILRSAADARPGMRLETEFADGAVRSTVDAAGGGRDGGESGQTPELREGPGAAGGDRGGDGKRRARSGKDGGGLRGGPEAGQAVLF